MFFMLFEFMSFWWFVGLAALFSGISYCLYETPHDSAYVPFPEYGRKDDGEANGGAAGLSLLGFFAVWFFFGDLKAVLPAIAAHWIPLVLGVVGYLCVGAVWAVYRWKFWFMPRWEDHYLQFKRKFLTNSGIGGDDIPDSLRDKWMAYLERSQYAQRIGYGGDAQQYRLSLLPELNNYKMWICNWILWWFGSAASYFLHDFVLDIGHRVYKCIAGFLNSLAFAQMKKYDGDLARPASKTEEVANG